VQDTNIDIAALNINYTEECKIEIFTYSVDRLPDLESASMAV